MGRIFEDICVQYMWEQYSSLPTQPKEIGRWRRNNPVLKQGKEIDIVFVDGNSAIFDECKFENEKTGIESFENLERKSNLFKKYTIKYFYFFSKNGFTEQLLNLAKKNKNIKLFGLDELVL
jgi:hypothetical protein